MKKIFLAFFIALTSLFLTNPQSSAAIGNPCWYYSGPAVLPCIDGIYYGWVNCGMASGEGYFYFYDGSIFHGNFCNGVPHGQGEVISLMGYISGIWNNGIFVQTTSIPQYQIQNYFNVAQNNFYSTPQVQNNYQNQTNHDFTISDYNIEDVSDTAFGRQLMGKMSH